MRNFCRLLGLIIAIVLVQVVVAQEGEMIRLPVTLRLDKEFVKLKNTYIVFNYESAENSSEVTQKAFDTMKESWSAVRDLDAVRYEFLTAASEQCNCKGFSPSLAQMNAGASQCSEFSVIGSIEATPVRIGFCQMLCENRTIQTVSMPVIESGDGVGHCPSVYFTPEFALLKISVGAEKGLHNSAENTANKPNEFLEVPLKFCEEQTKFLTLLLPIRDANDPGIKEIREWYLETEGLLHKIDYTELYESRQLQEYKSRHSHGKSGLPSGFFEGLNELEFKNFIEQQKCIPKVVAVFDVGDLYVVLCDTGSSNRRWRTTLIRRKENKLLITNNRGVKTAIEEVILKSDVVNEFLLSK